MKMKRVLLLSLMTGGLMFGAHRYTPSDNHLSEFDRVALKTSSPRVHIRHRHHRDIMMRNEDGTMVRTGDRVVTDKTTINAFVPVGK
jgi:hypothetical protein